MMQKELTIYHFSGTGNTKKLVDHFSNTVIEKGHSVDLKLMEEGSSVAVVQGSIIGLAFPVAMQSTFPVVWNFVDKLPEGEGVDIFMFDTMESLSGGIVGPMKKVLTQKGYNCIGAREFRMSSSLNTKQSKIVKGRQKNSRAMVDIERFAMDLIQGKTKWRRVPVFSALMRSISAKRSIWTGMSEKLSITEDCTKCLICVKNCPVSAIKLEQGRIEINHSICNVCMRCVSNCPQAAILMNGKKVLLS